MSAPFLMTLEETVDALRIAHAAREYVLRSEELAKLLVESEKPLDPKIELRTGEAWARLLEAVRAPKTEPPTKKGRASKHGPKLLNSSEIPLSTAGGQTRSCLRETRLATYVKSVDHFRNETKKAGAEIVLQNHPLMVPLQANLDKLQSRKKGDANPQ